MLTTSDRYTAIGIDSGYTNTGIAVVNAADMVMTSYVVTPPKGDNIQSRIDFIVGHITLAMHLHKPVVMGIEVYTAPSVRTRAMSAKDIAWHNWLIGACLMLPNLAYMDCPIFPLEAKLWQHELTGVSMTEAIGGKKNIELAVSKRTGYDFTKNSGGHKSDAAGIALIAMDHWILSHGAKDEHAIDTI